MISNENLGGLMGAPVVGADDDRIGTVGQVFVDPTTGSPNWVTVHTGWFGRHETFVPLDDADWDREVLHVPYDKDLVKDAPRIDTDEALSPGAEQELYRYYGMGESVEGQDDEGADAPASATDGMRLRKYQVTEEKEVTVPVTHEEVRLEPEPGADASPDTATDSSLEPDSPSADDHQDREDGRKRKGRHRA